MRVCRPFARDVCPRLTPQDHTRFLNKAISITGSSETMASMAAIYAKVTGKSLPAAPGLLARFFLKTSKGAQNV